MCFSARSSTSGGPMAAIRGIGERLPGGAGDVIQRALASGKQRMTSLTAGLTGQTSLRNGITGALRPATSLGSTFGSP